MECPQSGSESAHARTQPCAPTFTIAELKSELACFQGEERKPAHMRLAYAGLCTTQRGPAEHLSE